MDSVLIDSSAWIDFFRRSEGPVGDLVLELLEQNRATLCGMVELELLQGAPPQQQGLLRELLPALPYVDTSREDFIAAGNQLARLRRSGITIPASDGLIAALCIRHELSILTLDAHFEHIPELQRVSI